MVVAVDKRQAHSNMGRVYTSITILMIVVLALISFSVVSIYSAKFNYMLLVKAQTMSGKALKNCSDWMVLAWCLVLVPFANVFTACGLVMNVNRLDRA